MKSIHSEMTHFHPSFTISEVFQYLTNVKSASVHGASLVIDAIEQCVLWTSEHPNGTAFYQLRGLEILPLTRPALDFCLNESNKCYELPYWQCQIDFLISDRLREGSYTLESISDAKELFKILNNQITQ